MARIIGTVTEISFGGVWDRPADAIPLMGLKGNVHLDPDGWLRGTLSDGRTIELDPSLAVQIAPQLQADAAAGHPSSLTLRLAPSDDG